MNYHIKNARIVNEGIILDGSVLVKDGMIEDIIALVRETTTDEYPGYRVIDAGGKFLIPGVIDDQVHFREPGLTQKADIYTESRAAVAGGITSFMEMPNTIPNTLTQDLLEEKYRIGAEKSLANYSFYMGASNDNLDEVIKTNPEKVCGIKVFMGSSTGNMLVDNPDTLKGIFRDAPALVAVHCEDEVIIQNNLKIFREQYGEDIPIHQHPNIRNAEACYKSSALAVELAEKYGTRLHVLHLTTAREMALFRNDIPLMDKKITSEVCVHHLWFSAKDYDEKGTFIKWNPAIKTEDDRNALFDALLDNRLDVIATDHAPHTLLEKNNTYFKAPSGGPLVQHSLVAMMEFYRQGKIPMERIVEKMCHAPATCFGVQQRGYIRKGYFADLVIVDPGNPWEVNRDNIFYKCGWSPFDGTTFNSKVLYTFVNGNLVYDNGKFDESTRGQRLLFEH
nr:dihydroorotase [Bacteroidota bacterium]